MVKINLKKRYKILLSISLILLIWFAFCLPKDLFKNPTSTVLFDKDGKLLSARIASDGQWRFYESDSIPIKFETALLTFEDQYFYYHPGVNLLSIFRAIKQNIEAKRIVSGGSTITSQVIRLSRKGKSRTVYEKVIESILAIRAEIKYSKEEILLLYSSHAPFGGNVVGLDAASWRYYGRPADKLSWGEAATLAVLPNAPSLVYPGKNHEKLLKKRNRLLDRLYENGELDSLSCDLAKMEPLPGKPKRLPQFAPHLLNRSISDGKVGRRIHTTIDLDLQELTLSIIKSHYNVLSQNEILNAAAIIIDVETGNILSYVGNTDSKLERSGKNVDIITSNRSTGSILKPFLYAMMQKDGLLLPNTLIPDIPTQISGYNPQNFDKKFDGAEHAGRALARSLNVPAVRMLRDYGVERFHHNLNQLQLTTINRPANVYGLSLILGGAEAKLGEVSSVYASMARILNHYRELNSKYCKDDFRQASYIENNLILDECETSDYDLLSAGPIWLTFEALSLKDRPMEGANWNLYNTSKKIAWKTGTSFGHRDAWAIGVTPEYVVGVWVGNADGEGRPGLTGSSSAAPIMFDLYKLLPQTSWFSPPYDDLTEMRVCSKSGYKASMSCDIIDTIFVASTGAKTTTCPYHKKIHLDKFENFRVNSDCYNVSEMVNKSWFILPPVMEWYYKSKDPYYKSLPPYDPACFEFSNSNIGIIYPKESSKLFIPKGFESTPEQIVFEVTHRIQSTEIHWHIDKQYLGSTSSLHQMEITARVGTHTLTLVDELGEELSRTFEIISR